MVWYGMVRYRTSDLTSGSGSIRLNLRPLFHALAHTFTSGHSTFSHHHRFSGTACQACLALRSLLSIPSIHITPPPKVYLLLSSALFVPTAPTYRAHTTQGSLLSIATPAWLRLRSSTRSVTARACKLCAPWLPCHLLPACQPGSAHISQHVFQAAQVYPEDSAETEDPHCQRRGIK